MVELVAILISAGALAAVLGALVLLGRRVRRRGIGGAITGPIDEIYHPGAHRSRQEIQVQSRRGVTLPSPDTGAGRGSS